VLPDTDTKKGYRRWPEYTLAAISLTALLVGAAALLREDNFAPGEKLYSPGFKDVAVSTEDTAYPPSDVLRFDGRPEVVYVYLTVEDLPKGSGLEARVEHSGQQSVLSWLLSGEDGLEVTDGKEEHLGSLGGGVSGAVKFAVRAESGEPLLPGDYTVSIYAPDEDSEFQDPVARKYFMIQD
jgi:hypothetical protein